MLADNGLTSIWGETSDPKQPTTCNARTYLQPQINTAVGKDETSTKGDVNLKDWIIFNKVQFVSINCTVVRDNQGNGRYPPSLECTLCEAYVLIVFIACTARGNAMKNACFNFGKYARCW